MNERVKRVFCAVLFIVFGLLGLSFLHTILAGISMPWCIIGFVVCLSVIFMPIYYKKLRKKPIIRRCIKVYGVLVGVGCAYIGVLSLFMVSAMMNTPQNAVAAGTFSQTAPQTVIVLGCQTINGYPSEMLKSRLDKAAEYLAENPTAVCITTGGQGGNEIEPEAVTMKRYLITKGIEDKRIYAECMSKNTQENLAFASEILHQHNLPNDLVIVSEGYHLYRSQRQAEKLGFNAMVLAADSHNAWYALPSCWLRESVAITRDYVAEMF